MRNARLQATTHTNLVAERSRRMCMTVEDQRESRTICQAIQLSIARIPFDLQRFWQQSYWKFEHGEEEELLALQERKKLGQAVV